MPLANDIQRCTGIGSDAEGWGEHCETCLRRTSPGGENTPYMEPPMIIVFECPWLIEPELK